MTALIASYTSTAGGSERILLDVARGLDEPPLIACPPGWLADRARASGLTVFELRARSIQLRGEPVRALARLTAHGRELRRLVDALRPGVFVAWGMRTALVAAPALRSLDHPPRLIFEHVDFVPAGPVGRAVRRAAVRADAVVCLSRAIADDLGVDGEVQVIHPGVDVAHFAPGPERREHDVLLLGAIVGWKRPELALAIAARAARELPELRLRVAGAPIDAAGEALLARLRERAAQPDLDGRIEFLGALADPSEALRQASSLLHCAEREPFGLALAEALACGTPVVAPAAGGPAEIVDSSCGALYPPGDAGAGAQALVATLGRAGQLRRAARERAESAFGLAAMQERYRELLGVPVAGRDEAGAGIAFVTVTYNSAPELEALAASIARWLPAARLVVVDNASADDSRALAERAGATLIALDSNRGFGAAANAGVEAVTEPVTILVNPDVELVDDSLATLAAQVVPGRLLAPLLLNRDGSRQDSAHPVPATAATALHSLVPGPALPPPLRRAAEPWQAQRARRVGWATGACLVAQTETLRRLGPFDASIFLYAEDLELGLRAETWFHPEARVLHSRAHSTAKEFGGENYDLLATQRRAVVRRRLGARRAIVDDVIELMTFADRALLRGLVGRSARRETERFRARVRAAVSR